MNANILFFIILSMCLLLSPAIYYIFFSRKVSKLKSEKIRLSADIEKLKQTEFNKPINIDCQGIINYYVTVRKEASRKAYRLSAEILVYTTSEQIYDYTLNSKSTQEEISFHLHRIYWGNGGYISFVKETGEMHNTPSLHIGRETKVICDKGDIYYVTLSTETVPESAIEADKLKAFQKNVYKHINKMLDDTVCQHEYFAEIISDYREYLNLQIANDLKNKKRPALKASETIRQLSSKLRETEKQFRMLKYQMSTFKNIFPWIGEFEQITLSDIKQIKGERHNSATERKYLSSYLSPKEFNALSHTEKYQLALERYKQKNKSNWQIGIEFERYIGYLYESKGYKVTYYGAKTGLEDLGRDLIAYKDSQIIVIQCKYWKKEKTIHEKHIFQLFGTMFALNIEQQKGNNNFTFEDETIKFSNVTGAFITTTTLSDTAKLYAEKLNIQIYENVNFDKNYPCIKCNIAKDGEKIYHLPFDQQYDNIVINPQKGECYVNTVQEAEDLGFRHAIKWINKE